MINLSQAAASEIKRLRLKQQKPNAMFRLGAKPGGCADLVYTLEFDEAPEPGDRICDCHGLSVVVAEQQLKYINGLTLDYSEDMMGGGFRFHNPHAKQSCGCGNSFSV
jgi:iron-sulfur cluster assembly accessory protein